MVLAKEWSMTLWNLYLAVTNYLTLGKLLGLSTRVALPVNVVCVIYTQFAGYFETNCEDICGLQRQIYFLGKRRCSLPSREAI